MSPRKLRLLEDKALRDAARANVTTDVELIKADMQQNGPGKRMAETGGDYVRIFADGVLDIAQEHKGKVAGGVALGLAGLAAWFFREPILAVIDGFLDDDDADETGDAEPIESENISEAEEQTFAGAD